MMPDADVIRRDLVIHTLASTVVSYLMLSRAADVADMTNTNYWWAMIVALLAGGIQTAGLVIRCRAIDWWNRRERSA
jgi:cell division protein FtsW (lipid II flippase)